MRVRLFISLTSLQLHPEELRLLSCSIARFCNFLLFLSLKLATYLCFKLVLQLTYER